MALSRERKEELVAEYAEMLRQSRAIIFTEYRGLTNLEMTKLRRAVREADGTYRVVKLSLLKRAMEEAGYPIPEDLESTPIALSFCLKEIPSVAKALSNYAADSDLLSIRGGLMGDQFLTAGQIKRIADLPPLDILRAQILGLLDAPAASLAGMIQAGLAQIVNVLHAYTEQGEQVSA